MTYTQHMIGKCNPNLQDWEYASLKQDIATNGIRHPIIIYQNEILDGWHRYQIANELGIEIQCTEYTGSQPGSIVKSSTLHRNMTKEQQSCVLDELNPWLVNEQNTNLPQKGQKGFQKVENSLSQQAKASGIDKAIRSKTAKLKREEPSLFLKVKNGESTLADAKREIDKKEHAKKVETARSNPQTKQFNGPFDLILADPPWRYDGAYTKSREVENHYDTCTVEQIISHKPNSKADCILLLWATAPLLEEALQVMNEWGFEYKTQAVWDKVHQGMGFWFLGQHELLLVGTKGKPACVPECARVSSVFREQRTSHSKKPVTVYEWIERAFPDKTKLEMYCRSPRDGWSVIGNEI